MLPNTMFHRLLSANDINLVLSLVHCFDKFIQGGFTSTFALFFKEKHVDILNHEDLIHIYF